MSSIAPMTHLPPPAPSPDDGPVVSLQQRVADRLARATADAPVERVRRKKERAEAPEVLPGTPALQLLRAPDADALVSRRDAASTLPAQVRATSATTGPALQAGSQWVGEGRHAATPPRTDATPPRTDAARHEAPSTVPAPTDVPHARVDRLAPAQVPSATAATTQLMHPERDADVPSEPSTSPSPTDTIATAFVLPPHADVLARANPPAESPQAMPRFPAAPPPAPSVAPSDTATASVTVAFQSWGPGHEVHAHWMPGGGVLVPGSERVGLALAAAASQPGGASVAGDGWRVEHADADPEQRQRQRRDAEQDA